MSQDPSDNLLTGLLVSVLSPCHPIPYSDLSYAFTKPTRSHQLPCLKFFTGSHCIRNKPKLFVRSPRTCFFTHEGLLIVPEAKYPFPSHPRPLCFLVPPLGGSSQPNPKLFMCLFFTVSVNSQIKRGFPSALLVSFIVLHILSVASLLIVCLTRYFVRKCYLLKWNFIEKRQKGKTIGKKI